MLSIVIPTYKSPDALDLCLRSCILGQTQKNQIIVVVDGTFGENEEILRRYQNDIDILEFAENMGLCYATNMGVYNAGENILVVNDDNVFPHGFDKVLLDLLKENPNSVITPNQIEPYKSMFSQFYIRDLGRNPTTFNLEEFWSLEEKLKSDKIDACGSTLPFCMKRLNYLKIGGWDERYRNGMVADWDFFLRCQLNGFDMIRTYESHFYHFVSLTTTVTEEQCKRRADADQFGHEYAKYKWGSYIKHDPITNIKSL